MYLSYDEYVSYGGTLTQNEFNNISYDVEATMDYYTFYRLVNDTTFSDKVKKCEYKLIDLYNTYYRYEKVVSDITNPVISNQSNDGVSVSYGGYLGNTTPSDIRVLKKKLDSDVVDTIRKYLINERNTSGELLLYRGVVNGK